MRIHMPQPSILGLTSYHHANGERIRGQFIARDGVRVRTLVLDDQARARKLKMFERFSSQREVVEKFPVQVERFRVAPRYLFTEAPHEGVPDYERFCVRITGSEWRASAARALELLRARKRSGRRVVIWHHGTRGGGGKGAGMPIDSPGGSFRVRLYADRASAN